MKIKSEVGMGQSHAEAAMPRAGCQAISLISTQLAMDILGSSQHRQRSKVFETHNVAWAEL